MIVTDGLRPATAYIVEGVLKVAARRAGERRHGRGGGPQAPGAEPRSARRQHDLEFLHHRPMFATVVSAFIVIAGLAAFRALPVAMYPNIVPPQVSVIDASIRARART